MSFSHSSKDIGLSHGFVLTALCQGMDGYQRSYLDLQDCIENDNGILLALAFNSTFTAIYKCWKTNCSQGNLSGIGEEDPGLKRQKTLLFQEPD